MNILPKASMVVDVVKIRTKEAQLLLKTSHAQVYIETQKGGAEINNNPIKLEIYNRYFFDSIGLKSNERQADEMVQESKQAVIESMRRYALDSEIMLQPHNKDAIAQIALQRTHKSIDSMLIFIPENKPEISWSGGEIDISYTPDKVNISWETHQNAEFEYEPYSVEYFHE